MSSGELLRLDLVRYGGVAGGRRPDLQMEGSIGSDLGKIGSGSDVIWGCAGWSCCSGRRLWPELWRKAAAGAVARGGREVASRRPKERAKRRTSGSAEFLSGKGIEQGRR
jgi:hypothetical protein